MRAYLEHFRSSWPTLAGISLVLACVGSLPAITVVLLSRALAGLQQQQPIDAVLAALVGVACLQLLATLARSWITRRLAWTLVHRLRCRIHAHFLQLPVSEPVGARLAALTHEVEELQYGVSAVVTVVRAPVAIVSLCIAAAYLAPGLAWRFSLVLPIVAVLAGLGGRGVRAAAESWRQSRSQMVEELTDQHSGLATLQDLGIEEQEQARMQRVSRGEADSRARLEWVRAVPAAGIEWLVVLAIALLLYWGQHRVSAGALVSFAVAVALLRRPLVQLAEVWSLAQRSFGSLARVEEILGRAIVDVPVGESGVFELDGSAPGRVVARCRIEAGEKIALVGASGSGKSSFLAVLAGQLAFEGHRQASSAHYLRQDPWVFHRTLRENLQLGGGGDLEAMLGQVGFSEAIPRLDEQAGERGRNLSGGERQRLCLARTLLDERSALLLDEVTSELDPTLAARAAELLLQQSCTVVFASHHPWFAAGADRVAWFDEGRLIAVAAHDDLLEVPGYRRFWRPAA